MQIKPTSLAEMRQAAQSANEYSFKDISQHQEFKETYDKNYVYAEKYNELANAVIQLCDEVERLREVLKDYSNQPLVVSKSGSSTMTADLGFFAREALKESYERLKE